MAPPSPLPVVRVLAPNPGPFTLEGTNTWVIGSSPCVVLDPGPDEAGHRQAILDAAGTITGLVLTHRHADHAAGAEALSAATDAPVHAAAARQGERLLRDGDRIVVGDVSLEVLATPGHSPDHVALYERATGSLFTGDAILGRGTSVIDPPEGDLSEYLDSLDRMRQLDPTVIFPGHGPIVEAAVDKIDEYLAHRHRREEQVLRGLAPGPHSPAELVPEIYASYPEELRPAAARSVLAHLVKLEREGTVVRGHDGRFSLVGDPRPSEGPARPGTAAPPG